MGTLYTSDAEYKVKSGQIFIIYPNELTKYVASDTNPWTYIWIGFNGELAKRFHELPRVIDIKTGIFNEMITVETMISMHEEFLVEKLFQLYRELFYHTSGSKYTNAVKNFIDSNYMLNISVESIASTLNLNRRYLSRIFKQDVGLTIQEYLLHTRFRHATDFLSNGFSVNETAGFVGYKDQFIFSRMYKKFMGISPSKVYKKEKNIDSDNQNLS